MTAHFVRSDERTTAPATVAARRRRLIVPRQHGAWALLAVPLVLGVAWSSPSFWHLVLAAAAVAGYLTASTAQSWARARFASGYGTSLLLYGALATSLAVLLAISHPPLLALGIVVVPAGLLTFEAGRSRKPRLLVESLAQVSQALVLAPAAAWLGGAGDVTILVRVTALAALFLVSSLLSVRSVIRERGNRRFAAVSGVVHVVAVPAIAYILGPAYGVLAILLAARAILVPVAQRELAGTRWALRPIQLGLIEGLASIAVVVFALALPTR